MDIITQYGMILIVMTALFGFLMAFGIGANDAANAMGTSVGSRVLTVRHAIIVAVVFEFAGAYLAGGEVTSTIKSSIVDIKYFVDKPEIFAIGMTASLLAAGIWLLLASRLGWPVSTTHTIIGAIIGFGLISVGYDAVQWYKITGIVGSWFVTPMLAGAIAYLTFLSMQKLIFDTDVPFDNAKKYGPYYVALTFFVVAVVTLNKGLKHIGLHLSWFDTIAFALVVAFIAGIGCYLYFKTAVFNTRKEGGKFSGVEQIFAVLMIVTACSMAFAHGSNDVANAIGPLSAVVSVVEQGAVVSKVAIAWWVLPLGGLGIVVGIAVLGYRIMGTLGTGITELTPSRGFTAEFACVSTVIIASGAGLPISTTQTLVGAILGVGIARGIAALNLSVIRNIVMSWVITLPAGAIFAIIIYQILRMIFGL